MISHSPQQSLPAKEWHSGQIHAQTPHSCTADAGESEWRGLPAACLAGEHPPGLEPQCRKAPWLSHSPLPTEGHQGVSAEHVLCAWGQPYPVSSPGRYAAFTYLMRFYGFRRCKLYSLSQTSKTFLHLPSLTCQVSLGML